MAITATTYELLKSLRVERGSSLLEIGEANWYGDLDPLTIGLDRKNDLFAIAKHFYAQWFSPERIVAIDRNGTPNALKLDLNGPIDIGEKFDVVINHGTSEHIFNIGQVFKTAHDHCDEGGWMIHDAPFTGWVDHGFYCLQPTLFYDLAHANCYEVAKVAIHEFTSRTIINVDSRTAAAQLANAGKLPANSMLFVAFRKRVDREFRVPMQGYYAGTLSAEGVKAWRDKK
jgi:hypothetical protein